MKDTECVEFLQWALPRMDMRWRGFRKVRKQVCKRISRRMAELGLTTTTAYRDFLDAHPNEWTVLDSFCRITISRFYRDHSVFRYLGEEILPELAKMAAATGQDRLRCWCAGCASGEEVYTLKMVWRHNASRLPQGIDFQIVGTDIEPIMIERAQRGCFEMGSLKEVPEDWLVEDLEPTTEGYRVRDYLRTGIEFRLQDIRTEQPKGPFHLILCRNLVFTYFEEELQFAILGTLLERLVPSGILVTAKQESLPEEATGLEECAPHTGVYRKTEGSPYPQQSE